MSDVETETNIDSTTTCSFLKLALYEEILDKFDCVPDKSHSKWEEYVSYLDGYGIQAEYVQEQVPLILKTIDQGIQPYTYTVTEQDILEYVESYKNT